MRIFCLTLCLAGLLTAWYPFVPVSGSAGLAVDALLGLWPGRIAGMLGFCEFLLFGWAAQSCLPPARPRLARLPLALGFGLLLAVAQDLLPPVFGGAMAPAGSFAWQAAGLVCGMVVALLPPVARRVEVGWLDAAPAAAMLLLAFLLMHLLPFGAAPSTLGASIEALRGFSMAELQAIEPAGVVRATALWLLVGVMLQRLGARWLAFLALPLFGAVVLLGQALAGGPALAPGDLAALAVASVFYALLLCWLPGRAGFVAALLMLALLFAAVWPLLLRETPLAMDWRPLVAGIDADGQLTPGHILRVIFVSTGLVWLLRLAGLGSVGATIVAAAALGGIEAPRLYFEGPAPDVALPLFAILAGLALASLRRAPYPHWKVADASRAPVRRVVPAADEDQEADALRRAMQQADMAAAESAVAQGQDVATPYQEPAQEWPQEPHQEPIQPAAAAMAEKVAAAEMQVFHGQQIRNPGAPAGGSGGELADDDSDEILEDGDIDGDSDSSWSFERAEYQPPFEPAQPIEPPAETAFAPISQEAVPPDDFRQEQEDAQWPAEDAAALSAAQSDAWAAAVAGPEGPAEPSQEQFSDYREAEPEEPAMTGLALALSAVRFFAGVGVVAVLLIVWQRFSPLGLAAPSALVEAALTSLVLGALMLMWLGTAGNFVGRMVSARGLPFLSLPLFTLAVGLLFVFAFDAAFAGKAISTTFGGPGLYDAVTRDGFGGPVGQALVRILSVRTLFDALELLVRGLAGYALLTLPIAAVAAAFSQASAYPEITGVRRFALLAVALAVYVFCALPWLAVAWLAVFLLPHSGGAIDLANGPLGGFGMLLIVLIWSFNAVLLGGRAMAMRLSAAPVAVIMTVLLLPVGYAVAKLTFGGGEADLPLGGVLGSGPAAEWLLAIRWAILQLLAVLALAWACRVLPHEFSGRLSGAREPENEGMA